MRCTWLCWDVVSLIIVSSAKSYAAVEHFSDEHIDFYRPGTDFLEIPELRNQCDGPKPNNASRIYTGPMFQPEFRFLTSSEKSHSRFKLLDWKKRRRREATPVSSSARTLKMVNVAEQKAKREKCNTDQQKGIGESRPVNGSTWVGMKMIGGLSSNTDPIDDSFLMSNISNCKCCVNNVSEFPKFVGDTDKFLRVYTQPNDYDEDIIHLSGLHDLGNKGVHCSDHCLDISNATLSKKGIKGKRKERKKRDALKDLLEEASKENSYEYSSKNNRFTDLVERMNPINATPKSSRNKDIQLNSKPRKKDQQMTETVSDITIQDEVSSLLGNPETPVQGELTIEEKEVKKKKGTTQCQQQSSTICASTESSTEGICCQKMECHPMGTGPLSPISNPPEPYGPKMEEEEEDALTGKLADRVVEVVMATMGKCPKKMKELGLCAQGNLTKVVSSVSHPESKGACQAQSSDALKTSVLQDIAQAVERLANSKSSGMCLKPPQDLYDFLCWLLSQDADSGLSEPNSPQSKEQPRRDVDYLFRSNSVLEDMRADREEHEHGYHGPDWFGYLQSTEDDEDYRTLHDDHRVNYRRSYSKIPRNFYRLRDYNPYDNPYHNHDGARRRRYTPWSLNDYP